MSDQDSHGIPDEIVEARASMFAAGVEVMLAKNELDIAAFGASIAMQDFAAAFESGIASDVAAHPDLAELNVMLDGYYGEA